MVSDNGLRLSHWIIPTSTLKFIKICICYKSSWFEEKSYWEDPNSAFLLVLKNHVVNIHSLLVVDIPIFSIFLHCEVFPAQKGEKLNGTCMVNRVQ